MTTNADERTMFQRMELLSNKLCQTQGRIFQALEECGLTLTFADEASALETERELLAIRQLIGASDLCIHENEHGRCDWSRSAHDGANPSHAFVEESTLDALKRVLAERYAEIAEVRSFIGAGPDESIVHALKQSIRYRVDGALRKANSERLTDEGRDKLAAEIIVYAINHGAHFGRDEQSEIAAIIDKYRGT